MTKPKKHHEILHPPTMKAPSFDPLQTVMEIIPPGMHKHHSNDQEYDTTPQMPLHHTDLANDDHHESHESHDDHDDTIPPILSTSPDRERESTEATEDFSVSLHPTEATIPAVIDHQNPRDTRPEHPTEATIPAVIDHQNPRDTRPENPRDTRPEYPSSAIPKAHPEDSGEGPSQMLTGATIRIEPDVIEQVAAAIIAQAAADAVQIESTAETERGENLRLEDGGYTPVDPTKEHLLPLATQSGSAFVGRTFGHFRILEEIGHGSFGTVYKAEHIQMHQEMALKVLHVTQRTQPHVVDRFQREAQVMSRLHHDNIVRFYDFGALGDVGFYLVMEYLHGEGLDTRFSPSTLWPLRDIRNVIEPLCDALACVHDMGLVHRDLKPSNIILCEPTHPNTPPLIKLLDFGIVGSMDGRSELTSVGTFLGTAQYVSPEQARGLDNIDARTDLYSLGVILFRMLTGQLPFDADSQMDIVIKHIHQTIPTLAEIAPWKAWSPPLELFLHMAMAKEPQQRPASAKEFKALFIDAMQAQERFEREDRTVIDGLANYADQENLAVYVAQHGELPSPSSSTMHIQLNESLHGYFGTLSPFAKEEQAQVQTTPQTKPQAQPSPTSHFPPVLWIPILLLLAIVAFVFSRIL